MQPVADLLRAALRNGDEQGITQVRSWHLPDDVMADLVRQTHQYALKNASEAPDGWLIFRGGIEPWWRQAGDLTDEEWNRLYMLRGDVVKRLTEQDLAYRPHPRSVPFYVRPPDA